MYTLPEDDSIFEKDMEITPEAETILRSRYLLKDKDGNIIETPSQMCMRVATEAATAGAKYNGCPESLEERKRIFYWMLSQALFSPNSPTWMNAGTKNSQNAACFVLPVNDSMPEIFDSVKGAALIHQSGGGTGFDFSNLRPAGDVVRSTGGVASGPVSFMTVFNAATETIKQGGKRRGANIGILRVDHPDIESFITCKEDNSALSNFNISVGLTDKFMQAVEDDEDYEIINPRTNQVVDSKRARDIFDKLVEHSWRNGEPGIIFLDHIESGNPTPALGRITATNPCGEQPLLPYEACHLGSVNLQKVFLKENMDLDEAISTSGISDGEWLDDVLIQRCKGELSEEICHIDWNLLRNVVRYGIDFLDSVIDVSVYPLPEIDKMVRTTRKIGLGIMGLADLFICLKIPYASVKAELLAEVLAKFITHEARQMSRELAEYRGAFPAFEDSIFSAAGEKPLRNATVTTVAPTGTISMIANASSGCEPIFGIAFTKQNVLGDKKLTQINSIFLNDISEAGLYSEELIERIADNGGSLSGIPEIPDSMAEIYRTALEIDWEWHVRVQAAVQRGIDNAVSKTINMAQSATVEDIKAAYLLAYKLNCKGLTVYRSGSRETEVISTKQKETVEKGSECSVPLNSVISKLTNGKTVGADLWGKVKPIERPELLSGITSRVPTPLGTLWATLNLIDEDKPFELFCQISKAGTDIAAFTEAIARLISLSLRSGVDPCEIVHQLRGIGGSGQVGFGPNRVLSVPDAIGRLLEQITADGVRGTLVNRSSSKESQSQLPFCDENESANSSTRYDLCPVCGNYSLVYSSGCCECRLCGYSAC